MQIDTDRFSPNQLVDELERVGVYFLQNENDALVTTPLTPAELIMQLATSNETRLRLALIPLFLRQPALAGDVHGVVAQLSSSAQLGLKCYYTAAQLLQQKYRTRLQALFGDSLPLPDLFLAELGLPTFTTPDQGLQMLAERHRTLSGRSINWLGTYEHGAQRLLTHGERKQLWQKSPLAKSSLY